MAAPSPDSGSHADHHHHQHAHQHGHHHAHGGHDNPAGHSREEFAHRHHHNKKPEDWFPLLEGGDRDEKQMPDKVVAGVLAAVQQRPDSVVVGIVGPGTGYFVKRFAAQPRVAKVVGVDVQADIVAFATKKVAEFFADTKPDHQAEVELRCVPFDDPQLAAGSCDVIFICDVAHHIDGRDAYWPKVHAALRAGGVLAIVDWDDAKAGDEGPPRWMRISKDAFVQEVETNTPLKLLESHDYLPRQYFIIFGTPAPAPAAE